MITLDLEALKEAEKILRDNPNDKKMALLKLFILWGKTNKLEALPIAEIDKIINL